MPISLDRSHMDITYPEEVEAFRSKVQEVVRQELPDELARAGSGRRRGRGQGVPRTPAAISSPLDLQLQVERVRRLPSITTR